jgi:hypothetical protein
MEILWNNITSTKDVLRTNEGCIDWHDLKVTNGAALRSVNHQEKHLLLCKLQSLQYKINNQSIL